MQGEGLPPREGLREAPRASVAIRVQYRFDARDPFADELAVDLSASGLLVRCVEARRVGAMVELVLVASDGVRKVRGFGRVARVGHCPDGSPAIGIQFVSLDERDLELLRELVAAASDALES